jgi:hypothetical protein
MDGFVKVTLMEPYIVNGKNVPLKMRYGSSEAKATMFEDEYGRARSKSVPGKPVIFTMDWETGHKAVIMPEGAARMYFGHWDIPEVSEADTAPWQNTKFERERVATNWGGYTTASLDSDNKKNYILPYIAAPNVPHVLISDVNDNGEEGMLMFDPWERYMRCRRRCNCRRGLRTPIQPKPCSNRCRRQDSLPSQKLNSGISSRTGSPLRSGRRKHRNG